jgi:hypothetical protein
MSDTLQHESLAGELIDALANVDLSLHEFQLGQAKKQPDNFVTLQGIVIPVGVPFQVSAKRVNRNTIIVSNTGTDKIYVGNSSRDCQTGKSIGAGGQRAVQTRQAVWVYMPTATPEATTTIDLLETLYGEVIPAELTEMVV